MNAELKRREHIVILDVTECLMAEEITFCHNTSPHPQNENSDNKRKRKNNEQRGREKKSTKNKTPNKIRKRIIV
jgi:hypothetical protein